MSFHSLPFPGFPASWPIQATTRAQLANRVVTPVRSLNSIRYVPSRTAQMLTKRRAVDFCRVATAMCPCSVPFVA